MNLFDVVGGRQEIEPRAASLGVNIGQTLGGLTAQAGPAAFALSAYDRIKKEQVDRAALQVEQQKARAAGVQRIITEGMMAPEGSGPRKAAEALAFQLQSNPVLAQATGFSPDKFKGGSNFFNMASGGVQSDSMGDLVLDSVDSYGKAVYKNPKNSASFLENKGKAVEGAIGEIKSFEVETQRVADALKSAEKITGGIGGKIERGAMKLFDSNNPMLGEWQKVKSILTDAQLMKVAKTKGAISDREMELFATAAANDDIASLPAIKVVLSDVLNRMQASRDASIESVKKNYGEDLSTQSADVNAPLQQLAASKGVKITFK